MKMVRSNAPSLRGRIAGAAPARFFWDRAARLCVNHLTRGTSFGGRLAELAGRSVVVATSSQLTTALALIELDGVARRLTILPPDTAADHLGALIACAEADAVVIDDGTPEPRGTRSSRARRLHASHRHRRAAFAAARADRMGVAHVRHVRRAENGGAQPCQPDRADRRRAAASTAPSSGARSTTSAATAACRYFCARSSAARRWCCRAPASRSPIILSGSAAAA